MTEVAYGATFVAGAIVVALVFLSAVSTVVVPRGVPVRLTRAVFVGVRSVFELRSRAAHTYEQRDHAMALYAPLSLVLLPLVWISLVLVGYSAMFAALGVRPVRDAFVTSGSSLLTLGFTTVPDLPTTVLAFTEAAMGLVLLALLITYLPSYYAAFSRREALVSSNAIAAGSPPSGVELLSRFFVIKNLDGLTERVWTPWATWFTDIEETHTSLSALALFRSPQPQRSWVTAAGSVLDAAALLTSTVDVPRQPPAALCIRTGSLSLREIANFFDIPFDPDPAPDDPITIARDEWEEACAHLEEAGVALKEDRDQAWRDFAGWRVNYDSVLIALAGLTMAPYAPWSSDRSPLRRHRPPIFRRPKQVRFPRWKPWADRRNRDSAVAGLSE